MLWYLGEIKKERIDKDEITIIQFRFNRECALNFTQL